MLVLERACGVYTTCLDRNATDCAACGSALTNTLSSRFSLGHTLRLSLRWTLDLSPSQGVLPAGLKRSTHESERRVLATSTFARDTLVDQVDAMRSSGSTAMRVLEKSVKKNDTDTNGDDLMASNQLVMASNQLAMTSNRLVMASNLRAMASNRLAMASNQLAMTSNRLVMASNQLAMTSNLRAMASNQLVMASNQLAMTSNRLVMASNLRAMASNRLAMA